MSDDRHARLGRRRFLGAAAAGCALALSPVRGVQAALAGERRISLFNLHTSEWIETVFWRDGSFVPKALAEIDWLMRDFRAEEVHEIDPALLDLLHGLCDTMAYDKPIHVISGYRCPKTNAMLAAKSGGVAKNSYHLYGMAIDPRLPGRSLREVQRVGLDLARGGVGFYPKSDFVHLDTGPVRRW